jgi:hypothetical protein
MTFLLAAIAWSGSGQTALRAPSVSVRAGPGFLFGVPSNSRSKALSIVNMGASLSVAVYKGAGLLVGIRGGDYKAPNIPEGYSTGPGLFSGAKTDAFNHFKSTYALLSYDWHLTPKGRLLLKPGLGIASTQVKEAHFQTHVYSGGGFFSSPEPTHDVSFAETTQRGLAAQLSVAGSFPLTTKGKSRVELGTTFWTVPGHQERFYGLDIYLGFTQLFLRTRKVPSSSP